MAASPLGPAGEANGAVEGAASEPVMSVPCHLYGRLMNDEGTLHVYADKLEFVAAPNQTVVGDGDGGRRG